MTGNRIINNKSYLFWLVCSSYQMINTFESIEIQKQRDDWITFNNSSYWLIVGFLNPNKQIQEKGSRTCLLTTVTLQQQYTSHISFSVTYEKNFKNAYHFDDSRASSRSRHQSTSRVATIRNDPLKFNFFFYFKNKC